MQLVVKDRETITGVVTVESKPLDLSGMPAFSVEIVLHAASGTGLNTLVQPQTSNNLEDWSDIGGSISISSIGAAQLAYDVTSDHYQKYVRFQIAINGTNPMVNLSLFVNTFPSS